MKKKARREPRPGIWISIVKAWFTGESSSRMVYLYTVASTKKQATQVVVDGVIGLPGCEGHELPADIRRLSVNPPLTALDAVKVLNAFGYRFIAPYQLLKDEQIAWLIVELLVG